MKFRRCPRCKKKGAYYARGTHYDPEGGWRCRYCLVFLHDREIEEMLPKGAQSAQQRDIPE